MQSFGTPRSTTNPYITMLDQELAHTPGLEHVRFSWREALTGELDGVHLHWPESLLSARNRRTAVGKHVALAFALARWRVKGVPIIRTVHNLELPDAGWAQTMLLRRVERQAEMRILINPTTRISPQQRAATIVHGHYRTWFEEFPKAEPTPGRVAFVGLVRRYKGVERLLEVFAAISDPTLSLTISGKPSSKELAEQIQGEGSRDPRITTDLRYLDDADLVRAITSAQIVVLPYRFMHNSGSALAALSLNRPVLVPRNEATQALADEVGPGWVYLFDGELDASDITATLGTLKEHSPSGRPDLTARDWTNVGPAHLAAYRQAIEEADSPGV